MTLVTLTSERSDLTKRVLHAPSLPHTCPRNVCVPSAWLETSVYSFHITVEQRQSEDKAPTLYDLLNTSTISHLGDVQLAWVTIDDDNDQYVHFFSDHKMLVDLAYDTVLLHLEPTVCQAAKLQQHQTKVRDASKTLITRWFNSWDTYEAPRVEASSLRGKPETFQAKPTKLSYENPHL